ncbi:hypothetical protein DM860_007452 [Cuscuta australis]|uniref:Alcohol dehydrogenase-like C-terminal domain-containing protein n=1 Tax=Cuscuta australis TaxID=267555 RepID=A0A328E3X2_9ASTE|nr:hypothetical protein DM860_007452 [Cuscuta australis]
MIRSSSNDDRSGRAWAVTGLLGQRYPAVRDAVYPPFGSSSLSYHLGFCQVHQSLRVTVISTSADKKQEAIERFGVDSFLISCDPEQMQATKSTLDGIIDTVSIVHPLTPLLSLLKTNGDSRQHNITPDVEIVPIDYVNTAMERLAKADVKYGFVLDFFTEE